MLARMPLWMIYVRMKLIGLVSDASVDQTDRFGKVTVGVGGVLGIKKLIDELSGMTDSLKGIVDTLNPVQAFITSNLWLVAIGIGGFIVWKSGVLKKIRLEKHKTGRDVSV